jgi:ABC-2 type transport system permease protein
MFSAMIKKELLLVFRDKQALMALFVMPAIFILIMSVAMRDQFSVKNIAFTLFVSDVDKTQMSTTLLSSLEKEKSFQIVSTKKQAQFFVTIPNGYETNSSKHIVLHIQDSLQDNEIKAFEAIFSEYIYKAKFQAITDGIKLFSPETADKLSKFEFSTDNLYDVEYNHSKLLPNSTQQSVPAWIVFGMFFIIIPMSTIYINERKQNTLTRLNSMNISLLSLTFAKSVPYFLINQVQVWIMIAVGIYLVPFFDTPALEINGSIFAILEVAFGLSISAIGISTLIAVSANSSEQATTIGGISNILLGAVGGVMVPKFIMPESMQHMAELSPMSWGLDGFLDIFLTSADGSDVLQNCIKLTTFGLLCLGLSMIILHVRIKKGL